MPTRALRTAASGMYAQQLNIQVISNNIANINTNSFKKNRAEFMDQIYQEVIATPHSAQIPGIVENTSANIQVGNGVIASSTQKIFQQGDLQQTGNQFDIAINGEGFFQVRRPDGSYAYTRDGALKISADGSIVNSSGYIIEPGFTLDQDVSGISIGKDGLVTVVHHGGESIDIGNIDLVKFINPAGLRAMGENLFSETESSGPPILGTPAMEGFGSIHQGFLESSNVDIVEEMISMISAQRAYEINSKTVKTVEEMMSMTNNLKR